ncbi:MAG: hypothetical protein MK236_01675, partial [Pedosphaera sp.]|nr:hypothetical protein [Pedosphaera sp.]
GDEANQVHSGLEPTTNGAHGAETANKIPYGAGKIRNVKLFTSLFLVKGNFCFIVVFGRKTL